MASPRKRTVQGTPGSRAPAQVGKVPRDPAGQRRRHKPADDSVIVRDRGYRHPVPRIQDSEYGLERMAREDQGQAFTIEEHSRKRLRK